VSKSINHKVEDSVLYKMILLLFIIVKIYKAQKQKYIKVCATNGGEIKR